ncbi:SdpI family protein [Paenibacillus thermoaerophilus]|uniref:SdpI family protein n=1 Tax=Paenibacillus thermoaerophilus TaxID=1215385 RepID=A0ABW2V1L0_9BACL|nr:DUF1648 domain-containing protein [Paenibacillus thermoaerophilus]TMV08245.1 SdpI family protein [Paenibacillus thermoaerophilus]
MKLNSLKWYLIAAALIAGLIVAPYLPEQVPIHFNIQGEPDNYASKWFAVLFMPGLMLAVNLLFMFSPKYESKRNDPRQQKDFEKIQTITTAGLLLLHGFVLAFGYGLDINIGRVIGPVVGLTFIVMGNYMPRLRPNNRFGIRLPSTLSDETVWRKVHQVSGRLYVAGGILLALTALLPSSAIPYVFLPIVLITALFPIVAATLISRRMKRG